MYGFFSIDVILPKKRTCKLYGLLEYNLYGREKKKTDEL